MILSLFISYDYSLFGALYLYCTLFHFDGGSSSVNGGAGGGGGMDKNRKNARFLLDFYIFSNKKKSTLCQFFFFFLNIYEFYFYMHASFFPDLNRCGAGEKKSIHTLAHFFFT